MFIVIELQTNQNGQTSNIATTYTNRQEAESKYHQILTAAATSNVSVHAAVILNERGEAERNEFYRHESEVEE